MGRPCLDGQDRPVRLGQLVILRDGRAAAFRGRDGVAGVLLDQRPMGRFPSPRPDELLDVPDDMPPRQSSPAASKGAGPVLCIYAGPDRTGRLRR